MDKRFWKFVSICYIPVFLVALVLNGWLMYYSIFLKGNIAITTNFVNEATYQDVDRYQIEVNYFSNEKKNGQKVLEIKFNYYVDVSIPEIDDETGLYDDKLLCSSAVQFYGNNNFSSIGYPKGWGNVSGYKMNNVYFYEQAANVEANRAMKQLDKMNKFIWDIGGQLCMIETKGEVRTGTGAFWSALWFKFDTTFLCKKLEDVAFSLTDGEHIQLLNFSDFYHVKLYNEETGKFEEEYNNNEELTYVNVYFNKTSNGMVEAQQSMFGKFKGSDDWSFNSSEVGLTQLYWNDYSIFEITEDDFAYVNSDAGFEIYLKNSCRNYLEQFDGFALRIDINLDNISSQVVGLKRGGLYDFNIYEFTITSSIEREFNVYKDYDITTSNVTIVKGGDV